MNDYKLDEIAKSYAKDIVAEVKECGGDAYDLAHEMVDGCGHVIYCANAHVICQNCDTSNGEAFLEELGAPENPTYDRLATLIAYGELLQRVQHELNELGVD